MIKRFLCWLWGHEVLAKAYTGETFAATNYMGDEHRVSLYRWERQKWCLRCGKEVPLS